MTSLFRIVAYAAWALAFGLSVWLAVELHERTFGIALGVAVLALVLSAFGLILARHCAQQKDRLAMTVGIVLWAAGALTFSITEFGFWYNSYKDRHAEYVQAKKSDSRQEGLNDQAWNALSTGQARATSAELEASIKAAHQSDYWGSSDKCTSAKTPKARNFCQGYFELEAKLASAGNLEKLETRLSAAVKPKEIVGHNVFAAADLLSENSNLTERQSATIVVLMTAMLLMLSRDLLLIVAQSIGSASAARTAVKAPGAMEVAPKASSPLQRATEAESKPAPSFMGLRPADWKPLSRTPDDTPPGDAARPGSGGGIQTSEGPGSGGGAPVKAGPVLVDENWTPPNKTKPRTKAERLEAVDVITKRWLESGAAIRCAINVGSPGIQIFNAYSDFCANYGIKPVNPSHFGRSLKRLKIAKANKAAGVRYGLRLVKQEQRRAAA